MSSESIPEGDQRRAESHEPQPLNVDTDSSGRGDLEFAGFRLEAEVPAIVPAAIRRTWMDETFERFANRCLPMMIANQAGWFILNPVQVRAYWNGGNAPSDVLVEYGTSGGMRLAATHFGHGIVTWTIPILFRTARGTQLLVRGPANYPKLDVYPLEGIVETSWSVASFTMNWKLLRPGVYVEFREQEPICMLVPVRVGEIERLRPVSRPADNDPLLLRAYRDWAKARKTFMERRGPRDWELDYLRGRASEGFFGDEHRTRLALAPFRVE